MLYIVLYVMSVCIYYIDVAKTRVECQASFSAKGVYFNLVFECISSATCWTFQISMAKADTLRVSYMNYARCCYWIVECWFPNNKRIDGIKIFFGSKQTQIIPMRMYEIATRKTNICPEYHQCWPINWTDHCRCINVCTHYTFANFSISILIPAKTEGHYAKQIFKTASTDYNLYRISRSTHTSTCANMDNAQ